MTVAVLPFNAGPNTRPALARQFANFACEIVRNHGQVDVNAVNYLMRLDGDPPRFANVNPSETLNEPEMIQQFFEQAEIDLVMDGLLVQHDDSLALTYRFFQKGNSEPTLVKESEFKISEAFGVIRQEVNDLASQASTKLPDSLDPDEELFGTNDPAAFLKFLEGFDALQYVERAQGQVALEFSPEPAIQCLLESLKADPDWEGPYVTLVQLCRLGVQMRIGDPQELEKSLKEAIEIVPDDARGYFGLGELYEATQNLPQAAEQFEKAIQHDSSEPAIYTRLGLVQMAQGMPVNAERNFRKAVEMEGDDKPSMDFLATVLAQSGRAHEVPALWRELIEKNPQNAQAHAKLAISLIQNGQEEDGVRAFDLALETLEDNTLVKRYYAPYLAQKGEFDQAMDFYEDCLDVTPTDVPLLVEYAQTLQAGGRQVEIPEVLKTILSASPDANTRAQTLAWSIELEQPKRVETVQSAQQKMEAGDFQSAVSELRSLKNWLADYWKMWALLSAALNRVGEYQEAEEAARQLIQLFPGCEPAYGELVASLNAQGRDQEAYDTMRYAASMIQGSLPIAVNLALTAKRVGKQDEARQLAKQIREAIGPNEELEPVLAEIEA